MPITAGNSCVSYIARKWTLRLSHSLAIECDPNLVWHLLARMLYDSQSFHEIATLNNVLRNASDMTTEFFLAIITYFNGWMWSKGLQTWSAICWHLSYMTHKVSIKSPRSIMCYVIRQILNRMQLNKKLRLSHTLTTECDPNLARHLITPALASMPILKHGNYVSQWLPFVL